MVLLSFEGGMKKGSMVWGVFSIKRHASCVKTYGTGSASREG